MTKHTYLQNSRTDLFEIVNKQIEADVESGNNKTYVNNRVIYYPGNEEEGLLHAVDITLGNAHPWTIDALKELLETLGF